MRHWKIASAQLTLLCLTALFSALSVLIPPSGPALAQQNSGGPKEIAITFDNLPATTSFGFADEADITRDLLDALKTFEVTATGFVVGEAIDGHFDLLGNWLNEGHTLGSMTYSNQDFHDVEPDRFFEDAALGAQTIEPMLDGFGQKKRYFRFPFLHYGPTAKIKQQAEAFFRGRSVVIAHATVVPEDYLYDYNVQKLGRHPDSAKLEQIGSEYLGHVMEAVAAAEVSAEELRQRPVRQILLLRANRLNAWFLGDILRNLQDHGYKFITLDRALADDVYKLDENYTDGRGIGYLDRILATNPLFASRR